jgi:hypothetical protein
MTAPRPAGDRQPVSSECWNDQGWRDAAAEYQAAAAADHRTTGTAARPQHSKRKRKTEKIAAGGGAGNGHALADNEPVDDGGFLLDQVHHYLGRFVAYPSPEAQVAHTLWVAHTHLMPAWVSTPRIAFLSPEPGSGKTRALEVMEPLVPAPRERIRCLPVPQGRACWR